MQATLTFNLPEETREFQVATRGGEWLCAYDEVKRFVHRLWRYHDNLEGKTAEDVVDAIYTIICTEEPAEIGM